MSTLSNSVHAVSLMAAVFLMHAAAAQSIDISLLKATPKEQQAMDATLEKMNKEKVDFDNIGRDALRVEVEAWDIDVRPDFQGLRPGKGSVADGEDVWSAKCASCHGDFGDSNQVFAPLVGGTTEQDVKIGRTQGLKASANSPTTTMMKVSTVSTLWDFIHRAMPWNAPKTLTPDETYAVVAYLLNQSNVVPEEFELSDKNIQEVQEKLPNRDGMVIYPGLWHVDGKADTKNIDCMTDCAKQVKVVSELPDHARNMNGNYAQQMRIVGPALGVNSDEPKLEGKPEDNAEKVRAYALSTVSKDLKKSSSSQKAPDGGNSSSEKKATGESDVIVEKVKAILSEHACTSCHAESTKLVGPSFKDISEKYNESDTAMLIQKIKKGGSGAWGSIPMPPHPNVSDEDLGLVTKWIFSTNHN